MFYFFHTEIQRKIVKNKVLKCIKNFLDGQLCCVKYSPLQNNNNNNKLSCAVVLEIFHAVPTFLRRRKHTLGVCQILALHVTAR